MDELILFAACLFSFSAALISLLFFLRFKKPFFFHVFLITSAFFLISGNSFYVDVHGAITSRIFICVFGGLLSLIFSYGIVSFSLDFIHVSPASRIRKIVLAYSAAVFVFSLSLIFIKAMEHPSFVLNILGIWVPTAVSVLLGILFFKRINTGVFKKEKWLIIILSLANLVLTFVLHEVPFVFIISVSILIYHIFYRFYFSSPIAKTERSLSPDFIRDFSITKREQEIILALLDGKSNKELAETFFVTQKTIEAHLANIYRKIGVKNRLELFSRLKNN
ncbi:MAG: helix-turn-helix transcriptional regulator [Treponema sp.]|nr:helix-turn-helix transcriptional regulator [Treponema sp.]MBQ1662848.1 helix-turn-helix transcriptional regulator [Treponema sp.]MBQ2080629.1 helix-turn-helix transcriptional regulator [Treponema sp.]